MDYYPAELLLLSEGTLGGIRLRVAALCVCIDHGYFGHIAFTEAEIAPFLEPTKHLLKDGKEIDVWINPHAFVLIQPTGNLERAITKVLNGLIESISTGELPTIQLRMSIDGEVDVLDTWIRTEDLYKWCEIRSIETGDLCGQYDDNENKIIENAIDAAETARKKLETPFFDEHFARRLESEVKNNEVTMEQYSKLLAENIALLGGTYPPEKDDRPLQARERHTLLTIIAALCVEAGYEYKKHAKTAGLIQRIMARLGLNIGETTIENHLKKIPGALESRMK